MIKLARAACECAREGSTESVFLLHGRALDLHLGHGVLYGSHFELRKVEVG
jgi:hypothetical protein